MRWLVLRFLSGLHHQREKKIFEPHKLDKEEIAIDEILSRLKYYKKLSFAGKEKFISRTERVLDRLQFSTAGNIGADAEKKVLIVASIVQITFGLDEFDIDTIEHVKIFENNIYDPKTKAQYKGLTFMNGNMYLSWEHFLKGIAVEDDGINLGLHETAHGLLILLKNSAYRNFDDVLKTWYEYAKNEISKSDENKTGFLRKYASASLEEFFSVCIENFFERPEEFRKRLPLIYSQLCAFLNQDPANPKDHEFIPLADMNGPETQNRLYLHKNKWERSQTVFILFSYFSLVAILVIKRLFLETFTNIIAFSIPCMFITYFAFKKNYLDSRRMTRSKYLLFSITAINPVVLLVFLLVNLVIPVSKTYTKNYKPFGSYEQSAFAAGQNDFAVLDNTKIIYLLDNNDTVPLELRQFGEENWKGKIIEYRYHYGLMGLKICDGVEVKNE
ncbi:MAG TPA: zinc-dependent peptidase [Bacteroidia bacterium]|nr:zinc-dependent peptidase [Bacteroidia bacterium]